MKKSVMLVLLIILSSSVQADEVIYPKKIAEVDKRGFDGSLNEFVYNGVRCMVYLAGYQAGLSCDFKHKKLLDKIEKLEFDNASLKQKYDVLKLSTMD